MSILAIWQHILLCSEKFTAWYTVCCEWQYYPSVCCTGELCQNSTVWYFCAVIFVQYAVSGNTIHLYVVLVSCVKMAQYGIFVQLFSVNYIMDKF